MTVSIMSASVVFVVCPRPIEAPVYAAAGMVVTEIATPTARTRLGLEGEDARDAGGESDDHDHQAVARDRLHRRDREGVSGTELRR